MRFLAVGFSFFCIYFLQSSAQAQSYSIQAFSRAPLKAQLLAKNTNSSGLYKSIFLDYVQPEEFLLAQFIFFNLYSSQVAEMASPKKYFIFTGLSPPLG